MGCKIAVIGAGSSYTPELFADLAGQARPLDVDQVALMDPNAERVSFIADVCRRLAASSHLGTEIQATTSVETAVAGADFVILQIRVGGLAARVRDEQLPMEFGMVGNETTGAGGFVCALRTVPAVLRIARTIEQVAPRAWVLNLSNPAGIVTEALFKHTSLRSIGFCNIPINTTYEIAELVSASPDQVRLESFGLNHLSWVQRAYVDGVEILKPLIAATVDRQAPIYQHGLVEDWMDPDVFRALGMIPSWYTRYFYFTDRVLQQDRCEAETKGQSDMRAEEQLQVIYETSGYDEVARKILESKGGARYYLPVLQAIESIQLDRGDVIVVDVRNGTALPDLPAQVCVEVPARVRRDRVEPIPVGPMPVFVRGLVQSVKAYEELTVQAAVTGDRMVAVQALAANPLVGSFSKARSFFERVLENERDYLPAFF